MTMAGCHYAVAKSQCNWLMTLLCLCWQFSMPETVGFEQDYYPCHVAVRIWGKPAPKPHDGNSMWLRLRRLIQTSANDPGG